MLGCNLTYLEHFWEKYFSGGGPLFRSLGCQKNQVLILGHMGPWGLGPWNPSFDQFLLEKPVVFDRSSLKVSILRGVFEGRCHQVL